MAVPFFDASLLYRGRYHTDVTVRFEIDLSAEQATKAREIGLEKMFKMVTTISISNMNLFDSNGKIKHYTSPLDVIDDFYALRITYYSKRKDYLAEKLGSELMRLDNKVRFILMVVNALLPRQ